MTALILQTVPFIEMMKPKAQAFYHTFLHALDAYAEAKMRKAVPVRKLRRAQRRIDRYRRLMHVEHKSPDTTTPAER